VRDYGSSSGLHVGSSSSALELSIIGFGLLNLWLLDWLTGFVVDCEELLRETKVDQLHWALVILSEE
jgi:hypothetical protein